MPSGGVIMSEQQAGKAFDLIHDIALGAQNNCDEPIPRIIQMALDSIVGLARYRFDTGITAEQRKLFGLSDD